MGLLRDDKTDQMVGRYSSFHSVEKILGDIISLLLRNERLKRLLYYTDKHALSLPKLNNQQNFEILQQIKIVPKLNIDDYARPSVIIGLDNFVPDGTVSDFRDFMIQIDIICSYDHWTLSDFKLRPYAIAGEIDGMINKSQINSSGIADFIKARTLLLDGQIGGISLFYLVHAIGSDRQFHQLEAE